MEHPLFSGPASPGARLDEAEARVIEDVVGGVVGFVMIGLVPQASDGEAPGFLKPLRWSNWTY